MENPNNKGGASKEDLQKYAQFRKDDEIKDIKKVRKEMDDGKIDSDNDSENYREPLGVSTKKRITVELSTGGDADGFKFIVDNNGDVESGVYYWADWGCYEEVELSPKELDLVVDYYVIYEW